MKRLIPALVFSLTATMVFSVLAVEYIVVRKGDATRLYRVNADASLTDLTSKAQVVSDDSPDDPVVPVVPPGKPSLSNPSQWFPDVTPSEKSKVASGLAIAYRTLAKQIESGKIEDAATAAKAATEARQLVLSTFAKDAGEWSKFDSAVSEEFGRLGLDSSAAAGGAFSEFADGLDKSSTAALSPELVELIIKLILQLVERILARG